MKDYTQTALKAMMVALLGFTLIGCGSSSTPKNNTAKDEFISLDKRATYENGYLEIDGKKTTLHYSSFLGVLKNNTPTPLGIGLFSENTLSPLVIMSADEGSFLLPNFQSFTVKNNKVNEHYRCKDVTIQENESQVVKNYDTVLITGHNCIPNDINKPNKDVHIKLTESMIIGGASTLKIVDNKAYLNTTYALDNNLLVRGALGTRAYNQIFDLVHNHPNVKTIVEQQVAGSKHDAINVQTGRLIRKHGLNIHLESTSQIASGGVDLFLSGKKRTMESGAKIGVHSWAGTDDDGNINIQGFDLPKDSPLHVSEGGLQYIKEMLGDVIGEAFYFFAVYVAEAQDIHLMNDAEIEEYQLLTE